MQLAEFQNKINRAASYITENFEHICIAINTITICGESYLGVDAKNLFVELFKPSDMKNKSGCFYGSAFDPENQLIRVKKIREFEKYCIENESYRSW